MKELSLRYGMNPHQSRASVSLNGGQLPFTVLNGAPGYINLLDAFNSWQLVKELRQQIHRPAAASFKHVSPAGAAIGLPLSESLSQAYAVEDMELSPLATAYARARGADRLCSYGDWAALSDEVDIPTARLLAREVSDGVIAPGYAPDAFALLRKKKQGNYVILQMDPEYEPPAMETREVYGMTLEQQRNMLVPSDQLLHTIPTVKRRLPAHIRQDMLVALITLKYTQSNSICLALDGQSIGIGAGQQSRIHCVRLAAAKAEQWYLRQHPAVLRLPWKPGVKRPDKANAIDGYLREDLTPAEEHAWLQHFEVAPPRLTLQEKHAWLKGLNSVTLGSDGAIPFRDTIDCASCYGVTAIVQPGGSVQDEQVIHACNAYGMVMVFSEARFFHH